MRELAKGEGSVRVAVAPAVEANGHSNLMRWIESGYCGEMDYFANRIDAYRHPSGVLPEVRSIVAMIYPYDSAHSDPVPIGQGRIAKYVWQGDDYHDVIHKKLKRIRRDLQDRYPQAQFRGAIDTAPLLEREIAELAGLGWRGKNTLLLNKQLGSYFFLAFLLTDQDLPTDVGKASEHCGTCTACLDACPTDAFPKPGVLDATKCISYLTIEHRGSIPRPLREGIGDWVFGCDVCQEVCPWNRKPTRNADLRDSPLDRLELHALFNLSDEQFRERFRKTPLWRTRRRGILRNAAIVLGNQARQESIDAESVDALGQGLHDEEWIVREACAWALGEVARAPASREVGSKVTASRQTALKHLKERFRQESHDQVRPEIERVLRLALE